jgi:twitching motility two-component system response regulator PilH
MGVVLVVDDTQTDRQIAGQVVMSCGRQVELATNGEEGFQKASNIKPSLILLDIVMPGQDGFATCRKLKRDPNTATIPVVMVSTKGNDADKFWAQKQGADGYITKPYTADQLQKVIQQYA